jgi:hypothetical protein
VKGLGLGAGALAFPAAVQALGQTVRKAVPPKVLLPKLHDFWLGWNRRNLYSDLAGTTEIVAHGQRISAWRSELHGMLATAGAEGVGPIYEDNVLGTVGGLHFTGGLEGLYGDIDHIFSDGIQVAVICQFLPTTINYRGIFGMTPDLQTGSTFTPDGFLISRVSDSSVVILREENAPNGFANAGYAVASVGYEPTLMVFTLDSSSVKDPVDLIFTDRKGICHIMQDGGHPIAHDYEGYRNVDPIHPRVFSLGTSTSRFSPEMFISGIFLVDGVETPQNWQAFYDRYVVPVWGASAIPAMKPFPTAFRQLNLFHGPGLHVDYGKCPIDDLLAMGITWVRVSVEQGNVPDAGIDEVIQHYHGNGIDISWILSGAPIVNGDYSNPSAMARRIRSRYTANGLTRPKFELVNEATQLHVVPNTPDFPDETSCRAAYVRLLRQFLNDMGRQPYIVQLQNDAGDFLRKIYNDLKYTELLQSHVVWGMHAYNPAEVSMGNADYMEALTLMDVVTNEGQRHPGNPGVSLQEAIDYAVTMYQGMNGRPFVLYRAYSSDYNTTNLAYSWYDHGEVGPHGVPVWSNRTPTLTGLANALGRTLL